MSERVKLPKGYKPGKRERYMNPKQLEYFRQKLLGWREELLEESQHTIDQMREAARDVSDDAERASRETEISFELRTRDRYRKLLNKIGEALKRIDDESYGFCDETGEPIGIERLGGAPHRHPVPGGPGAPRAPGAQLHGPALSLGVASARRALAPAFEGTARHLSLAPRSRR